MNYHPIRMGKELNLSPSSHNREPIWYPLCQATKVYIDNHFLTVPTLDGTKYIYLQEDFNSTNPIKSVFRQ